MHSLYQRLKELDWDTFQRFCFQLLAEKHPTLEVRHVDGSGGDLGLDLFAGKLNDRPTIWQCKHFPNRLGPKQRPQVLKSLRTAIKHFKPAQWVLVISTDLDTKGYRWFQKLQQSYQARTSIGIMQASDIVRELVHRRKIRDAFFPGAVMDSITMNRILKSLGEIESEDLDQLTQDRMSELIARFEEQDSRFDYQIIYGPNVGERLAEAPTNDPRLVASVSDDKKRIDVFARDTEAIRLDPPTFRFRAKPSGAKKIDEFIRTGRPQVLESDEWSHFSSTFDFLAPASKQAGQRFMLLPNKQSLNKILSLRLTFSLSDTTVGYEFVQFRLVRLGTDEAEIQSIGSLPFVLTLVLPATTTGAPRFSFTAKFESASVREAAKAVRLISMLRKGCTLEIYSLDIQGVLGEARIKLDFTDSADKFGKVLLDAERICEIYNVDLTVPQKFGEQDIEAIALLIAIADGKPLPVDGFHANLVKSSEHEANVNLNMVKNLQVQLTSDHLDPVPVVFGKAVSTGPITVFGIGSVKDGAEFLERYAQAKYGEAVPIDFNVSELRSQLGKNGDPNLFVRPIPNLTPDSAQVAPSETNSDE